MQHAQDNLLVANRVAQLMERHQIPRQKHAGTLAKTLGLSFAQAHRKMRGQSNWTFIELKQIANAFDASITVLVDSPPSDRQPGTPALLVGGMAHLFARERASRYPARRRTD